MSIPVQKIQKAISDITGGNMQFKRTIIFISNIIFFFVIANFLKYLLVNNGLGKELFRTNSFIAYAPLKNTGAAFGLFQNTSFILFILAVLIVLGIIVYVFTNKLYIKEFRLNLMSVLCAGILGNALERCFYGYVLDYIKIRAWDFPVFNLNDIMISVSAVILIIGYIIQKRDEEQNDREVDEDIY